MQVGDEFVFVARLVLHVGRQAIFAQFGFVGLEQIGGIDGLALIGREQAGDHVTVDRARRIGDGHVEHAHRIARFAKNFPQQFAFDLRGVDHVERPARGRMKSKTPCLPGFLPVMKVGHAGDVTGGSVDSRLPVTPVCIRLGQRGQFALCRPRFDQIEGGPVEADDE